MKVVSSERGQSNESDNLLDLLRGENTKMFNIDRIEIEWGAFKYKGKPEDLAYVMDEVFSRMPPNEDYNTRVLEEQARVNGEGYS